MIRDIVSITKVIDYLNELLELDRPAVAALIANRIPCNREMADHPSVQVSSQHGGYHVGMLGILNGIFGIDEEGFGGIVAVFEEPFIEGEYNYLKKFVKGPMKNVD